MDVEPDRGVLLVTHRREEVALAERESHSGQGAPWSASRRGGRFGGLRMAAPYPSAGMLGDGVAHETAVPGLR